MRRLVAFKVGGRCEEKIKAAAEAVKNQTKALAMTYRLDLGRFSMFWLSDHGSRLSCQVG